MTTTPGKLMPNDRHSLARAVEATKRPQHRAQSRSQRRKRTHCKYPHRRGATELNRASEDAPDVMQHPARDSSMPRRR